MKNFVVRFGFILTCMSLISCSQSGVQGTSLYSSFIGLETAKVLSPTTIQLSWTLDKNYSEYRVYQNGGTSPIKTEQFSLAQIQNLTPNTSYTFLVSGFSSTTNQETVTGGSNTVKTFKSFVGLTSGGVTLKSASQINLTWDMNDPSVNYNIFQIEQGGTWDFNRPIKSVQGDNQYVVSNLASGHTYCFYIVANYLDQTSEPVANAATAASKAICLTVTSPMDQLPSVSVSAVSPGQFPWFWTSNGNPSYKTEIHELDTDIVVASRTGNGVFRAFRQEPIGEKNYYALISSSSNISKVAVNISGGISRKATNIRALNPSTPIFPPLMAGGKGLQNMGGQIVTGDFNCDGLMDVAVSLHTSVISDTNQHYTSNGAVVIYYQYAPAPYIDANGNIITTPPYLKMDVAPSVSAVYPNPLIVTYPVTSNGTSLGKVLAVGNINNDCFLQDDTNSYGGNCDVIYGKETSQDRLGKIHQCQDLVIGANDGSFYTVFGDHLQGLVAGSGASTYGVNEPTCDPVSTTCRPVRMLKPIKDNCVIGNCDIYDSNSFGQSIAVGDFNNDGYDDVAVSGRDMTTNLTDIIIYRGSAQGLLPSTSASSHLKIQSSTIPLGNTMGSVITYNDKFGYSLAAAYNSRSCIDGVPAGFVFRPTAPARKKGYDFTKCDDLVIGMPGRSNSRGSIVTCKAGISLATASDPQKIVSWTCQEHYPTELVGDQANYGWSLLGVPNQIGYPHYAINAISPSNAIPNDSGALFVGAPTATVSSVSNAGKVFGYYVTPYATDYYIGGIQGILGNSSSGHTVNAINTVPCDKLNGNVTNGSLRYCDHQEIYSTPAQSGAQFGYSLSSLPSKTTDVETSMPYLAVGAPFKSATTATSTGAIYLYRGDVSNFGTETGSGTPVLITSNVYNYDNRFNYGCTTNCTWLSGGIAPFGPSIVYPQDLQANAHFGIGGAAGGSFNGDGEGDILSTAPDNSDPVSGNGAFYGFYSSGGFSPSVVVPNISIKDNFSVEGGYHFEQAKVVGDINGDGYDDVAAHIYTNGKWKLVIYYGSVTGLLTTLPPSKNAVGTEPLLVDSSVDPLIATYFFRAGDLNGDGFDDIIMMGSKGTYIYYGSSSGLVAQAEPSISPVGKNPLRFAIARSSQSLTFHRDLDLNNSTYQLSQSYDVSTFGVVVGDFNKDGYSDIAIRLPDSKKAPAVSSQGSLDFTTSNVGRVAIIYGSSSGPETNRLTGEILLANADGSEADVVVDDPCKPNSTPHCKVQLLSSPVFGGVYGKKFGFGLGAIIGNGSATSDLYDNLVVGDPEYNNKDGIAFYYKGGSTGLKSSPAQTLVPRDSGSNFGFDITSMGDVNGDRYDDIAISAPYGANKALYAFYGAQVGAQIGFYGASSISATDYWRAPTIATNDEFANAGQPRPQVIVPSTVGASDQFPMGMVSVGDFNLDGYADFIMASPNADYTVNGLIPKAGYATVLFGGPNGLQTQNKVVSVNPKCYGGNGAVCEPYQIFLPNVTAYESLNISNQSSGDINGDGLVDVVFGGFGRSLPSGKTFATGVIYVLY